MATDPQPNPRKARSRQAILDATRDLLSEGTSVRTLTVEAVAARSGVAKTTIYRSWRDKWELALDAVMIDVLPRFYEEPADVGSTREELLFFVDSAVRALGRKPFGPAMQGLVSEVATDPALARAYRERVVDPRLTQLGHVVERGVARGDLRPGTDVRGLHEFLLGPIYYRLLLSGEPLDRGLAERLVDGVLEGFSAG